VQNLQMIESLKGFGREKRQNPILGLAFSVTLKASLRRSTGRLP
jgi:hypothetical protein